MRIGIDIDDTLTNTYEYTIRVISKIYNLDYKKLLRKKLNYDELKINYPKVFEKEIYEKEIKNVKLKENAKKVINKLYKNNEIIIITARNKNECKLPYNLCYNYLTKNKIKFNKLIVETMDKGKTCYENKIDLFIDDSINNCLNVLEYGIDTFIFDNIYNKNTKIKRVKNWLEINKYIERINNGKNSNKRRNIRR